MNKNLRHRLSFLPLLTLTALSFITLPSCKPTERGYKSAYDAALAKRQASEADMNIPVEGLIIEGEPAKRNLNGRDLLYLVAPVGPVSEGSIIAEKYNLAVGCYKMPVNALDQARNLRGEGFDAFAVRGEEDRFYVILASFPTLEEVIAVYDTFLISHPSYPCIGLPGLTILENNR